MGTAIGNAAENGTGNGVFRMQQQQQQQSAQMHATGTADEGEEEEAETETENSKQIFRCKLGTGAAYHAARTTWCGKQLYRVYLV